MKPLITLKPFLHRGGEQIGIYFQTNLPLNIAIRTKAAGKWSQTGKCWYVPMNRESFEKIKAALPDVTLDAGDLKKYLENKNLQSKKSFGLIKTNQRFNYSASLSNTNRVTRKTAISPVNKHVLPSMEQMLKLKAYSRSTIRTYLNEMAQLLTAIKDIPADELKPEHLKRYLVHCYEKLGLKENTLHSRINGMKFYYEQVLKRDKFFWEIPRPKKQLMLPKVLNENEIGRLFKSIENIKHKAIVFTAYSAGLRVSEVVRLKIQDVDSQRMTLFIENAKGKKDRMVNLSPLVLDILRSYLRKSKPRPSKYLFEGGIPGEPYSVRSAQQVFANAKEKAGITRDVSFHALRHSFATHLLEKGVDIRYIKDILGHFDIKTTERYTHVSKRMLVNIVSPLDDLFARGAL